jgi:hypothetical protein
MKKIFFLIFAAVLLSGCATYKFQRGKEPFDKGYVVLRDERVIPEYTIGKDNSAPGLELARQRFERRRNTVEDYYKKMGVIENHLKMAVCDPMVMLAKVVTGVFKLPFIAVSDYRYEHDPKYKERIDKLENEADAREQARIKKLKDELGGYIQKDLSSEPAVMVVSKPEYAKPIQEAVEVRPQAQVAAAGERVKQQPAVAVEEKPTAAALKPEPLTQEIAATQEAQVKPETPVQQEVPVKQEARQAAAISAGAATPAAPQAVLPKVELIPIQKQEAPITVEPGQPAPLASAKKARPKAAKQRAAQGEPVAVIMAKPIKGLSPLRVQFYGNRSYSPGARIIAYSWDFGDGDNSTKANPVNTYWSSTFAPQNFTVTLTVTDSNGKSSQASVNVEVLNK